MAKYFYTLSLIEQAMSMQFHDKPTELEYIYVYEQGWVELWHFHIVMFIFLVAQLKC